MCDTSFGFCANHVNTNYFIFLSKASGTIVKSTECSIYVCFYDTESDREEIAIYAIEYRSVDFENILVSFDAYQLDPSYPMYCDKLFITWIVTKFEFKNDGLSKVL